MTAMALENPQLQEELLRLRHENESMRRRLTSLLVPPSGPPPVNHENHLNDARKELQGFERAMVVKSEENERLRRQVEEGNRQNEVMKRQLEEAKRMQIEKDGELLDLRAKVAEHGSLISRNDFLERTATNMQRKIEELEGHEGTARSETERLKRELGAAAQEIKDLRQFTVRVKELQDSYERVSKELVEAKASLLAASSRNETLAKALGQLESRRRVLEDEHEHAKQRLAEQDAAVMQAREAAGRSQRLAERVENLEGALRDRETSEAHMKQVIASMRQECQQHAQTRQELERNLSQTKQRLEDQDARTRKVQEERDLARKDAENWRLQTEAARRENESVVHERSKLQDYVAKLSDKMEKLVEDAHNREKVLLFCCASICLNRHTNKQRRCNTSTRSKLSSG